MGIPFTVEQFSGVFPEYNTAVWPAQWLLVTMALAAVALARRQQLWSGVVVSVILALLWAWVAVAYRLVYFTRISAAAYGFAALSMAGATVFIWQGVIRRRLVIKWAPGPRAMAGVALIVFALVVYPAWSRYAGHPYPAMPTFGLPCPTTIFTIGLLAFAVPPTPRSPLVVPLLGRAVGAQAAFFLGVRPDLGLVAAAAVGIGLLVTAGQWHQALQA